MDRRKMTVLLAVAAVAAVLLATVPFGGPLALAAASLYWALTVRLDGLLVAVAAVLSLAGCLAVGWSFLGPREAEASSEDSEDDGSLAGIGYFLSGVTVLLSLFALASGDVSRVSASWAVGLAAAPVLLALPLPPAWAVAGHLGRRTGP